MIGSRWTAPFGIKVGKVGRYLRESISEVRVVAKSSTLGFGGLDG